MNAISADIRTHALIFKALGHPARLQIVTLLAGGERCVCDLTEQVGLDISTISKHLAILVRAGVLVNERRANKIFHRLRTPCVLKVLTCLNEVHNAPDGVVPVGATCCP
jgi:DNA-binding transcriptional ArsR family regulator